MQKRVYDLAKELNIDSKQLLAVAAGCGVCLKSASSTVTRDEEATVLAYVRATQVLDATEARTRKRLVDVTEARTPKGHRTAAQGRSVRVDSLSEATRLFLPPEAIERGRAFADEVALAEKAAKPWVENWIQPKEAARWVQAVPGIGPGTVIEMKASGITMQMATEHLWYGKRKADRPSIGQRIMLGDISVGDAVKELEAAGIHRNSSAAK